MTIRKLYDPMTGERYLHQGDLVEWLGDVVKEQNRRGGEKRPTGKQLAATLQLIVEQMK
jgi:hypothetical protein